jgi:hypothetical protein
MDEQAARDVALVRALESGDAEHAVLSADDRRYASRAAGELAHWQAADQRRPPTAELFLTRRAGLLLDRLGEREPALRALRHPRWHAWVGLALPAAALVIGVLTEQIADRQHVNVLAFPLLGILVWNLVVYGLMLLRPLLGSTLGPVRRWVGALGRTKTAALPGTLSRPAARFVGHWAALAAPLANARAGRVLHLAAALFALGAVLGLYLRAFAFEYRIGWESTFLTASTVHGILQFVLGPAAALLGMPFPSPEAVSAMRITEGAGGADAGPWIHLYAVTVGLAVVAPRLLMSAFAGWRERQFANAFRFDLGEPYFRRALAAFAPSRARLRVAPYSYTFDEAAVSGLHALARHLLGDATELALRPSTEYGNEEAAAHGLPRNESDVPLTLAVFNAAATPESENHGRFLDTLRAAIDSPLAVVIDTAAYRRRLGAHAGAEARLGERCSAWRTFVESHDLPAACVALATPDIAAAGRDLAAALGGRL